MTSDTSNSSAPIAWRPHARWRIAGALFVAFAVVYQVTLMDDLPIWPAPELGALPPARSLRMDTLFDTDPPHIMSDVIYRGPGYPTNHKAEKHPLFLLYARGPSAALHALGLSPLRAVLTVTSLWAALAVALALPAFQRFGLSGLAAVVGSVAFGFSPAVWLTASVPETFGYNVLAVVLAFLLVSPKLANPRLHPARFAGFAAYAVLAIGATLPNALYVGSSFLTSLVISRARPVRCAVAALAMTASVVAIGALAIALQGAVYPDANETVTFAPRDHMKPRYMRLDRGWDPRYLAIELNTFLGDALIARDVNMGRLVTTRGEVELIQFVHGRFVYWVAVGAVLLLLVTAATGRMILRPAPRGPTAHWPFVMAAGLVLANLVFHYFYRSHGQPLIYSTHTVFPMLVLAAGLVGPALELPALRTLACIAVLLAIGNNARVMGEVQHILQRPCHRWQPEATWSGPKHPLCARWDAPDDAGTRPAAIGGSPMLSSGSPGGRKGA